ncbi:MAG: glutathione S-transferase family protein [Sulfitobacter sp.]
MDEPLTLIGFRYSVYTRIVRMALIELGLEAAYVEVDPFTLVADPELSKHTSFGRVPVFRHGAFTLTETAAIVGYLCDVSGNQAFRPKAPQASARMAQVIGIVDAYGYQPLVRDVFSHGFYRPHFGEEFDPAKVNFGLEKARPVLQTLDAIAKEGLQLDGRDISLADIHLSPMIAYFTKVPAGRATLDTYPALSKWWGQLRERPSLMETDPFAAQ